MIEEERLSENELLGDLSIVKGFLFCTARLYRPEADGF